VKTSFDEKWTWKPLTPGKRAGRGANLSGEIGKGGEIVAVQSHGIGELASGDLHAVPGIARRTG